MSSGPAEGRTIVTNLATIIRSLEEASENDNRKIALLLIVCELIRTGKLGPNLGHENEERLFKSIGAHFLARLLVTRQNAPGQNCSRHIYKSVCLSILTQFCSHPDLIQDPLILTRIDAFFDILKLPLSESSTSEDADERQLLVNLKLDTFKYLFAVAQVNSEYLCNNGLFDVLFNSVILNESECPEYKLIGENFETTETDFGLLACKLARTVLEAYGESASPNKRPHRFAENLSLFLSRVGSNKSKFKFQLVNYLNLLLSSKAVTDQVLGNEDLNETAAREIYSIMSEIFRSKQEVQLAFFLLKNFVDLFQFEYIYMKDRKFFYFIIHLTCIQMALNLENHSHHQLTHIDVSQISIYFKLLEDVIIILSTASPFDSAGEDDDDDDDDESDPDDHNGDDDDDDFYTPNKKDQSTEGLKSSEQKNEPELENVIKILVELLESVMIYLKDELTDSIDQSNKRSIALITSSIRLLMCWLSHESLLEKEIMDLVPRFISFTEDICKSTANSVDNNEMELFSFLSAGLQKVYLNLKAKRDLKSSKLGKRDNDPKLEFEVHEIDQEMKKIKLELDKCYEKTDKPTGGPK